ncbi:MAG: 4-hydroxy-3-methylbut-2-enyl diphosphate reductase [Desulfobacteraceae bacterium]|nr:4-hydroxy-3-methylbut-2-enyl diphosphate reductase [Desulfobacteraceae bacterium]
MKVIIAKTAGFCMGVRRAVEMALDAPSSYQGPIFTYGPLIHNPQVLSLFSEKGVVILDQIPEKGHGTILIRAHGVPPEKKELLKKAGFNVIDATCPRVVKVQSIIKSHTNKGYSTIIVGDKDHPEVVGLLGYAGSMGYVVGSLEDIKHLPVFEQAIIVAQTTQNQKIFQSISAWAEQNHCHYKVFDTICDSTEKRQMEVRRLSKMVDAVIVVGGKNSGNTRRLAEIVKTEGKTAFHVETEDELNLENLSKVSSIAITAGASTPSWIIKRVLRGVEKKPLSNKGWWSTFFLEVQRFLLLTNIYVALGAGCLCYAMMRMMELPITVAALAVAVFYVMSMHIFNRLTGRAEDKYNDPEREQFYSRNKMPLKFLALLSGAVGLIAAYKMGQVPFWTLLTMSLLGSSYNLRLIPSWIFNGNKRRRIRDLPGSKTILIALAWGVSTTVLPAISAGSNRFFAICIAFLWATGLVLGRTAFFDVLDMQGDRIVGKETIPLLIGEKKSFRLLKRLLLFMTVIISTGGVLPLFSGLSFLLAICPLFMLLIVVFYERGNMLPGVRMEFRVESLFVFSGVMTFIYEWF